ncbi:MAG: nuclear transport factor 2 family protein [Acidobacteriota bacterium]
MPRIALSFFHFVTLVGAAALLLSSSFFAHAEHHESGTKEDRAAVERAILDYIEAFYEVDPAKIERSVSPDLAKRGFFRAKDGYREVTMNFEQAKEVAARFNANGNQADESSPKEITLFEVLDRTASAKLIASWGIDYVHLKKDGDGRWRIANVIWQSLPEETASEGSGED